MVLGNTDQISLHQKKMYLNHKRVQAVTDSIRCVQLGKHNGMGGSFP